MTQDIHLDKELYELLFTDNITQRIARPLIWTRFRRDAEYQRLPCPSCNTNTGYKEGQYGCPYCKGLGYLWDEEIFEGYIYRKGSSKESSSYSMSSYAGRADNSSFALVTTKDIKPLMADRINIISLLDNGRIAIPIVKTDELVVTYDRDYKASHLGKDFNYCLLGK